VQSVDTESLFVVAAVAAIAPFIVDLPLRVRLPVVVVEILLGIIIGPEVLGITRSDDLIEFLGQFGLAFLFFMAGLEIDFDRIRGGPLRLAMRGWIASVVLGFAAALVLHLTGVVISSLLVGVALCTTALGTLMPILRDTGELRTPFGNYVVAAGAVGEFGPIVLISVLLTQDADRLVVALLLVIFTVLALIAAFAGARMSDRTRHRLARTMHSTGQLPMRLALLLLVGLVFLARQFGLDLILGAFAAGVVVGLASKGEEADPLKVKLEGMGFGFLIPIFFISTGLTFNLDAILGSTAGLLRLPLFIALLLVCRGLPSLWIYRGTLPSIERRSLVFYTATGLPLIVAVTQLGIDTHRMRSSTAAALVAAAMISVLVFPIVGAALRGGGVAEGEPEPVPGSPGAEPPVLAASAEDQI
jgi:Kef-type K+ transport system membrane component KefB